MIRARDGQGISMNKREDKEKRKSQKKEATGEFAKHCVFLNVLWLFKVRK